MSKENSKWYKASDNEMIGPFKCIKNYETKETEINSKKGSISKYSDTEYVMLIVKTGAMKKFLPEAKHAVKKGDEIMMRFPTADLELWAND
jgi:hypothetical protein